MSIFDWFLSRGDDEIDRRLDERITAADERIAKKGAYLERLNEECSNLQKQKQKAEEVVSRYERTLKREGN